MVRQVQVLVGVVSTVMASWFWAIPALAASPSLSLILPRGCQRGTETELTFRGSRLADAQEIFFYEPGFHVTKLDVKNDSEVRATVQVARDCQLGEHVAQVRTSSGVSEFRTFFVGLFATIDEKEPNSDFSAPQAIPLNATVAGVVTSEDVDYFVVEAKKGQRLSVEIEGMRLGTALFDPYVVILDSRRFELASADDTPLVYQDALASTLVPADGRYTIEVHESAYGGNNNCRYRLHVGTFPQPTAVYPAGGKLGQKLEVRFLGDPTGPLTQTVQLPDRPVAHFGLEGHSGKEVAPTPNSFRLSEYDNILEAEPNNNFPEATPAKVPSAVNGIISMAGDVDCFQFSAKKGQVFDVECFARRIRSGLDAVVNLYAANGRRLAGNDDARGPDSYFRFTIPADGEYIARISDHLNRGAVDFVYRIEITPRQPALTVSIPRVARYSQYRQWIAVPRGNRFATLVSVARSNFSGDVVLAPDAMPAGLTVHAEPLAGNQSVMPVVIEAAKDAPIGGRLVDFAAQNADPKRPVRGSYVNLADFIRGGPGQSIYWQVSVDRLPVVVVEELPFQLRIIQPKAPIVRNGSMQLRVVAAKKKGWDDAITVYFPFRPPGIGATTSVKIPKGKTEVTYPLNASNKAQLKKWPVYVLGSANVNGMAWCASQLASIEVAEPYVTFAMQRAAVEQGQEAQIVCQVTHHKPFNGTAKVHLLGLPAKATTTDLELTKETNELVFPVQTQADTPAGTHKNVFCQVVVTDQGEPVVHSRVGGTELRIDRPAPPKANVPAKPKQVAKKPAPKKPQPTKPVRLSRLQQLRLEAEEKRKQIGKN